MESDAAPRGQLTLQVFGRDLSVAFAGHLLKAAISSFTFLIISRSWHPNVLGYYSLAELVYLIGFQLSELGLSVGVNRFISRSMGEDDEGATARFLKAVFWAKLVAAAVVFVVGFTLAPTIAVHLLERPEVAPLIRIGLLSIFGMHLSFFYQAYFAARLEFVKNALFVSLAPFGILVAVSAAWWLDRLTVPVVLWIYALVPGLACAGAMWFLPHGFLKSEGSVKASLAEVWRFSRWVYVTNSLGEVRFRLNSVFLSRLGEQNIREVGLYNFADKLTSTVSLVTHTVLTVFIPRLSRLSGSGELRSVVRQSLRWSLLLVPVWLAVALAGRPLVQHLMPRYVEAVPIFLLLFTSVLFTLIALPSRAALYSMNRPQVETAIEGLSLIVTLVAGYYFTRSYLAVGAAMAMLLQRVLSGLLTMIWVNFMLQDAVADSVAPD